MDKEQQLGYRIAVAMVDKLGHRNSVMRSPDHYHRLPAQNHLTTSIMVCICSYGYLLFCMSQNMTLVTDFQTPFDTADFWSYHGLWEQHFFLTPSNKQKIMPANIVIGRGKWVDAWVVKAPSSILI